MAARLVARGFPVTVWDREPSNIRALEALGAAGADSPEAIASDRDVVISMLWDDAVAEAIVERKLIPAASAGTAFIEMTTITPAMQRRLAGEARSRACTFLDAPVTGSKEAAASGELTALVGGEAEVLEANRDVLETLAAKVIHVGPNGASGAIKLANNQLIALMTAAWGESVGAAMAGGVDRELAVRTFATTFARVAGMKTDPIIERDPSPHFTLDALLKDMHQALRTAESIGNDLPVLRAALPLYERAVDDGLGTADFSVMVDRIAGA
jgi:3-hydroxyisobutyrate dehydrogenase